eukprot:761772-Hanusia_phi.AAC.6
MQPRDQMSEADEASWPLRTSGAANFLSPSSSLPPRLLLTSCSRQTPSCSCLTHLSVTEAPDLDLPCARQQNLRGLSRERGEKEKKKKVISSKSVCKKFTIISRPSICHEQCRSHGGLEPGATLERPGVHELVNYHRQLLLPRVAAPVAPHLLLSPLEAHETSAGLHQVRMPELSRLLQHESELLRDRSNKSRASAHE